jgi:methionyl-tRNA synthetase
MRRKFYLTTPLYDVNGEPHVGHVYTTVIGDAIARYKRLCGFDVYALTGTDEHGLKIERAAKDQGLEPRDLTDRFSASFREVWRSMGLQFDGFIRTTEPRHALAVAEISRRIHERGFIYQGEYSGDYCINCEAYVQEGGGNCPDCGRPTESMTEESHFFKLSSFQEKLVHFYESNADFVAPQNRMNEIVNFVKGGLRDIGISRTSLGWGIPMPEDPKHIFYVWFDALTGYLSGIGFASDEKAFASRWPADVQLIGKDILRFHAVYWPAFLMAAGLEPPRRVLVNGCWTVDGERMSKSRGNVVTAGELTAKLPADYIKYFLLRSIPVGGDGDFSYEALAKRVNSDLANDVGNLANRTLKMIANYFDSAVPEPLDLEGGDEALIRFSRETVDLYRENFDRLLINKALENVWELVSAANRYIAATEPWTLAGDPARRSRLGSVLYNSAETLRIIALLLSPVVPEGSAAILRQLGIETSPDKLGLDSLRWGGLRAETRIGKVEAIYRRVDPATLSGRTTTERVATGGNRFAEESERISIEDFAKVEMRVGRIVSAERIAKSAKLLKLRVDMGAEKRQVVAGVGEAYDPDSLVGLLVAVVTNLQPVTLMGVESNGMIVAASDEGRPVLATFNEAVSLGARLR